MRLRNWHVRGMSECPPLTSYQRLLINHLQVSLVLQMRYISSTAYATEAERIAVRSDAARVYRKHRIQSELKPKHRLKHLKHLVYKAVKSDDFHGMKSLELLREFEAVQILNPSRCRGLETSAANGKTTYVITITLDGHNEISISNLPHLDRECGWLGVGSLQMSCRLGSVQMPVWSPTVLKRILNITK